MLHQLIPQNFNGAVSVSRGGQTLLQQACGYADLPNQLANQPNTRFATASAGKAFVAVGIMQLIQSGKLCLQTQIGSVLPFALNQIDPAITVQQLLNHTSGIPDYFDESVMEEYSDLFVDYPNYKIRTSADLLPLFIQKPMMYPAGQLFQYNNSGYVVLGLIIEAVAGQLFGEYLQTNLFTPFNMHSTGYYELDRLPARCANAYIYEEATQQYHTNIYSVDVKGTGAGGAFTTVQDVEAFWQNLAAGSALDTNTFAQMTTPQTPNGRYGYGFWMAKDADGNTFPYFQGSDPGVSFVSSYQPRTQTIVTAVSNMQQDVWALHKNLLAAL